MKKKPAVKTKKKNNPKLVVAHYYLPVSAALFILIVFIGYFFVLQPQYHRVFFTDGSDRQGKAYILSQKQSQLSQLNELMSNYRRLNQEDIQRVKHLLPQEKDIPGLLVQLEDIAQENNLILSGVTINETSDNPEDSELKRLTVSVELLGSVNNSYQDVKNFLSDAEMSLRIFDVNAVYFSPDSTAYSLNLYTYYHP